jgi:hypothetical protein
MARGDFDNFQRWAEEHTLDYEAPDVQDIYYTWVEIFSSEATFSDPASIEAFSAFLALSGFDEDEIADIIETYTED